MSIPLPVDFTNADGQVVARLEQGAAEGPSFATLRIFNGDVINVRNVQGGTVTNPNLDLGAGDGGNARGDIVFNWDVGRSALFFDGHKHKVLGVSEATGGHRLNHSYLPLRLHRGAQVPDGHGGWRKLT